MVAALIERLLLLAVRIVVRRDGSQAGQGRQSIYVANHASHADALLILAALPTAARRRTRPLAAADYWAAGPVRRYFSRRVIRSVPIDRKAGSVAPLGRAEAALEAGDSLILFPEGTRGPGGTLQPFKAGVFFLARAFPEVDVVPVWIEGSHHLLPKGALVPWPRGCRVQFGRALRLREGEAAAEFLDRLREAMEALRRR